MKLAALRTAGARSTPPGQDQSGDTRFARRRLASRVRLLSIPRRDSVAASGRAADLAAVSSDSAVPAPPKKEDTMPESAASNPDPVTTIARPPSSPDRAVPPMPFSSPDHAAPPMPSEVTNRHDRPQRPAAGGMLRTAMTALRTMVRRTPRS